jgi:hypothetical protein
MTVVNNIEIDNIQYQRNIIKDAIENNEPIEGKLHVVIVISNPCLFARRYILLKEFVQRMELEESNIHLYVVELAYGKQKFIVTDSKNKKHLQIRTEHPLWHKENMINVGIKKLLPQDWKAVAWIDADVEFESPTWVKDTLKILNGSKDIIQLFSHCVDMDQHEEAMNIFPSFGFQYTKQLPYSKKPVNFWHPGYAWACTRKTYEMMGGLYEKGILGSGDNIMALSFVQKAKYAINENYTEDYKNSIYEFQSKVKTIRIGYVPGIIRHYYHGSKKNRNYTNRWKMLVDHNFSPSEHITIDENGILIPTDSCPIGLLNDINDYFKSRNDDEMYEGGDYSKRVRSFPSLRSLSSINSINTIFTPDSDDADADDDDSENESKTVENKKNGKTIRPWFSKMMNRVLKIWDGFINPPCNVDQN